MIEIHKDALGNVSGYWDTERKCWRKPEEVATVHILNTDSKEEPPAADEDDAEEPSDYSSWTKDQLKEALDEAGVDYPSNATKTQLATLLQADAE